MTTNLRIRVAGQHQYGVDQLGRIRNQRFAQANGVAPDGGMGVGAAGFGVLAGLTGYPWAFAVTAVLMLGALAPALRDLRHPGH